jgi:hypothetical protein
MEFKTIEQYISDVLIDTYQVAEPALVTKLKETFDKYGYIQTINIQAELHKNKQDFESRKIALDAAVKTISITGGDLTENATKYKRFLLNQPNTND